MAVVVLTMNAASYPGQAKLVRALEETGTPVIAVAVRNPYDIAEFSEAPTFVATYSYKDVSLESLARVLVGEVGPQGQLPVDIPAQDDAGTLLFPFGSSLTW